jgi:hypothetical protein
MAVGTFHGAFKDFMVSRHRELMLYFAVATQAKLGFANFE